MNLRSLLQALLAPALALTLALPLLADAPDPNEPERMRLYHQILARRALETGEPSIAEALSLLRAQGFLPHMYDAVGEVQELEGRNPRAEARLRALKKAVEEWLRAYPYNGYHVYSNYRVLTNDWTPGKHRARMTLKVETRNRGTNGYHHLKVRVTVEMATLQVSAYEVLD